MVTLTAKLAPFTISIVQAEEFHRLKKEIFSQHVYFWETTNPQPRIIDAGAHIGLATLYFKKLFPGAQITAIEPLPLNVQLLETNIWQNGLRNIKVIPAALWPTNGEVPFYVDQTATHWFSTASTLPKAWNQQQDTAATTVSAITLSSLLTQTVDFLKLDIEGAELAVLTEAREQLHWVKEMIIEFHPGGQQSLAKLLTLLIDEKFVVQVWQDGKEVIPKRARGLVYVHARQKI